MHAVPESVLSERIAAQLPASAPPAPWSTRLHAVVWWHRATPTAAAVMPVALRSRRRLALTVAAFVRYVDTPVGGYREILATPVLLLERPVPAATIPFIAVDSLASIVGGRANWALPKTYADFEWPEDGLDLAAGGDGWSVGAHVQPRGPAFPFAAVGRDRQINPDGRELAMRICGRGRARLGRATVRVVGPKLPGWLRAGRHPAIILVGARIHFSAPRAA
jgi:Acetoacetate decarboxylase (ADC)